MLSGVEPANNSIRIDEGRTGKLRAIGEFCRSPLLRKTSGFIFDTSLFQCRIRENFEEIVVPESHCVERMFIGICDAAIGHSVGFGEGFDLFRISDDKKTNGNAGIRECAFELTQLRERFSEKRSTNVAHPHQKCGLREFKISKHCRQWMSDTFRFDGRHGSSYSWLQVRCD